MRNCERPLASVGIQQTKCAMRWDQPLAIFDIAGPREQSFEKRYVLTSGTDGLIVSA